MQFKWLLVAALIVFLIVAGPLPPARSASSGGAAFSGNFSSLKLDPFRPRLYLTSPSNNSVIVLNTTSDKELASIWVGSGPSRMDVSADGSQLYVTVSQSNYLAVINLDTLQVTSTIHLPWSPFGVAAGRLGRAYVTPVSGTGYPLIVDTNHSSVVGNITSGGALNGYGGENIQTSPNRDYLYVSGVCRFDITTDNVSLISKSGTCGGESSMDFALSSDGSLLYRTWVDCYCVQILNTSDWSQIGVLDTGPYPIALSLDSAGGFAVASAPPYDGLTMFNTTTFVALHTFFNDSANPVPEYSAGTVQLSADGSKVYVLAGDYASGPYALYVLSTNRTDTRAVPSEPHDTTPPSWRAASFLKTSNAGSGSVDLNWSPATDNVGVQGYRLFEGSKVIATVNSTVLYYHVSGLAPATSYSFSVEAVDFFNNWSTNGPSATVTTAAASTTTTSTTLSTSNTTSSTSGTAAGQGLPLGELAIAIAIVAAGLLIALAVRTRPR